MYIARDPWRKPRVSCYLMVGMRSLRFGEEALNEDGEGVGGALFGGDSEVRRGGADAFGFKEEERGLYLPM